MKKFQEFELLRSIAIIIVVFVHMDNYLMNHQFIEFIDIVQQYLAFIALSLFFLISGYLVRYKYNNISYKTLYSFYRKKILRLIPLYWLSIFAVFILFGYLKISPGNVNTYNFNYTNLVIHILCLQAIIPGSIQAMWFVGVIILYYFTYSLISIYSTSTKDILTSSIFIFTLFFIHFINLHLYGHTFHLIHIYSIIYYPSFVLGILVCDLNLYKPKMKLKYINIFSIIAYSSYSMYLFHIPLLAIFSLFLGNFCINEEVHDVFMIFFGIPITFIISYYIQNIYDLLLRHKIK